MSETPCGGRRPALKLAAGKEGVEFGLHHWGNQGFGHSCDQTGEKIPRLSRKSSLSGLLTGAMEVWLAITERGQLGGRG